MRPPTTARYRIMSLSERVLRGFPDGRETGMTRDDPRCTTSKAPRTDSGNTPDFWRVRASCRSSKMPFQFQERSKCRCEAKRAVGFASAAQSAVAVALADVMLGRLK